MEKADWIKNLKAGDSVLVIERWLKEVNKFEGTVSGVEKNYIETKHRRPLKAEWNKFFHAYDEITTKNYFSPAGEINIEQL